MIAEEETAAASDFGYPNAPVEMDGKAILANELLAAKVRLFV